MTKEQSLREQIAATCARHISNRAIRTQNNPYWRLVDDLEQVIKESNRQARIRELEMLPVMRKGLHTSQKELDIILVDTVKQRIKALKDHQEEDK